MIVRFLNIQGVAGLVVSLVLLGLLLVQKGETRHWRKQSRQFEQLYRSEQAAFAGTVANYRAAAEAASTADLAAAERVRTEQRLINERTKNDFEARLADARARANRLRLGPATAATDPGSGGRSAMPGLSASAARPDEAAGQDRLSPADALKATEQAIQLDELIKWVKAQAKVDMNGQGAPSETQSDR
jgi:hypothetical protein